MLGITRWAKHSSAEQVAFTIDLLVVSKDEWDAENVPAGRRAARPTPAVSHPVGWGSRLHMVAGQHGGAVPDHWIVRPGSDLPALTSEVLAALTTYGLPEIEHRLAVIEAEPRLCWHNAGGRNWFEPCQRPAGVAIRTRDRVIYRCAEHAEAARGRGTLRA